jgi:hypothetical protein
LFQLRFFAVILLFVTELAVWYGFFPTSQQKRIDRGIYLADADPEQSERLFRRVIGAGSQQDANVKLTLAWLDANRGAWTQTEQLFQNVDPVLCLADMLLLFARKAIEAKHFLVAIQALEPMRGRARPETNEALALLWNAYAAHGTHDDALAVGRELRKRQPSNHAQRIKLIRGLKGAYKEVECLDEVRTVLQFKGWARKNWRANIAKSGQEFGKNGCGSLNYFFCSEHPFSAKTTVLSCRVCTAKSVILIDPDTGNNELRRNWNRTVGSLQCL